MYEPTQSPTCGMLIVRSLGAPKMCIFARGRMAVCTESCQFVVPLEPAPPPPVRTVPSRDQKNRNLKLVQIF